MKSKFTQGAMLGILIGLLAFNHYVARAQSQGGPLPPNVTVTTQTATRADAAIQCQTTSSSAGVLTFSAIPGQTFYLTEVDVANVQSTTGVTVGAVETIASANLNGITFTTPTGANTTPGVNTVSFSVLYPTGLKSTVASTNSTLTNATTIANQVVRLNACGFYA